MQRKRSEKLSSLFPSWVLSVIRAPITGKNMLKQVITTASKNMTMRFLTYIPPSMRATVSMDMARRITFFRPYLSESLPPMRAPTISHTASMTMIYPVATSLSPRTVVMRSEFMEKIKAPMEVMILAKQIIYTCLGSPLYCFIMFININ